MRCTTSAIGCIAILLLSGPALLDAQIQSSSSEGSSSKPKTGNQVFRVGDGVTAPGIISAPDPEYSEKARKIGYRGTCVLLLVVDAKGVPQDVKVTRAIGMGLDEKAVEAVRQWRFKPAMKDGVSVAVLINVEVAFRLYGGLDDKLVKADAGNAKAQFEISQAFLSGRDVPKEDESRGFTYLEKAAKQGLPKAQFAMGEYLSSHGNDLVTAYVWYALAQKNRFKQSEKKMNELAKKMPSEQLVEARRRVESNNPF
jgi:TonB family protein